MLHATAVFIAICVALISASVGTVSYLLFGLSAAGATLVGLVVMTALAFYNTVSARLRDRDRLQDQIADLSRGTVDLARQVAEHGRHLSALEADRAPAPQRNDLLAAELGELGGLMKQLAETVAAHDALLAGAPAPPSPSPPPALTLAPVLPAAAPAAGAKAAQPHEASGPLKGRSAGEIAAIVRSAIEGGRIDIHLQPIVTLPQRKVRFYEALARIRLETGEVVAAADFLPAAEQAGLMPKLDNLMLFRCVQVVRRILVKNSDIGLFFNLSPSTLRDAAMFAELSQFMEANRALAPSLILEMSQAAWRGMTPADTAGLAALAASGFRFGMDHVEDLRVEPRDLVERSIRFIKVPGALLLGHGRKAASDIHAADLSDLLGRFGVTLIADKIEGEPTVVDLLDYDVRFGQGFLFSPPRPVRADVLQGDANSAAARPNSAAEGQNNPVFGARSAGAERQAGFAAAMSGARSA
jgi:cyclic-di-GMP phosphodiesterase TipF (flagellum assembly factor)